MDIAAICIGGGLFIAILVGVNVAWAKHTKVTGSSMYRVVM
jgi:hypothetical protein